MPDFYNYTLDSVKECIRAAGWSYDEDHAYEDEILNGEGMVVEHTPPYNEPYDPEGDPIELTVSTGREPDAG
jgi:eukaryotic-like serine/threonine-protein kinase